MKQEHEDAIKLGIAVVLSFVLVIGLWSMAPLVANKYIQAFNLSALENSGKLGDTFNVVGSLFTGLAFFGVLISLLLQRKQMKLQQEEMLKSAREQAEQTKLLGEQTKLIAEGLNLELQSAEPNFRWHIPSGGPQAINYPFDNVGDAISHLEAIPSDDSYIIDIAPMVIGRGGTGSICIRPRKRDHSLIVTLNVKINFKYRNKYGRTGEKSFFFSNSTPYPTPSF